MKKVKLIMITLVVLAISNSVKVNADPGLVIIGNGNGYSYYPYETVDSDARYNFLYTAAEITTASGWAGDITGLAFYVMSASPLPMNGFNIRMQSTSATSLNGFADSGWTIVYSGTYTVPGRGWQQIDFTAPFNWDGTSNLLVEICFDNTSYLGSSIVRASNVPGKTYGTSTIEDAGCNLATGLPWSSRPDIRLNMNTAPPGGTLQGTVTNCCSGAPVPGATVSCGGMTAITDAVGAYSINGIIPGTYAATCTFPPLYLPASAQVIITTFQTTTQNFCLDTPPLIITGIVTDVRCYSEASGGINTTVSGGIPPYTYTWSNGYHTANLSGLNAGTYTLCVTDANSCSSCETFVVTEPSSLYINAGDDQLVFYGYPPQECATLSWSGESGGTPPYSIQWNTGQTTPSITVCPEVNTDYTVTITDANNCTFSDDVKVCVVDVRCGNNMDKVLVCHNPQGTSGNPQTLCVAVSAVPAHLAHGDLLGACGTDLSCPGSKSLVDNSNNNNPVPGDDTLLLNAFPNPFSETAEISFCSPSDGYLTLKLIDQTGEETALLFSQEAEKSILYNLEIDGNKLSPGLYFCVLQHSDGTMKIKKLICIR